MNDAPRATILVPVYNSASTLQRCLQSGCAQTLRNLEIIVVDDASTDSSASIAESMAAADERIRVIRLARNRGKPAAMNVMMAQARGEWVAVLDADDAMAPERLDRLIKLAELCGVDMAADNLHYVDAGIITDGFGIVLRQAFDETAGDQLIGLPDMLHRANSFGDFDYGILKPVIRRSFVLAHALAYHEESRLAEDFTYLLDYMVVGGRVALSAQAMYFWTMPFGTVSRQWTTTGAGAWRYDYRDAIAANELYIDRMRALGRMDVVEMLRRRGRQYAVMVNYIDAQRAAAEGRRASAMVTLLRHPSTWSLLGRRMAGRLIRAATA